MYQGNVRTNLMSDATLLELARMGKFYDIDELQQLCINLLSWAETTDQPPSVDDFQRADFQLKDLLRLGCDPRLLGASGFSLEQFLEVDEYTNPGVLRRAFQLKDITSVVTCSTLWKRGWCWIDLAECGYSVEELTKFMKECLGSLEVGQRPPEQQGPVAVVEALKMAGVNQSSAVEEMMKLGYTAAQLKSFGWNSVRFQRKVANSAEKLNSSGYAYDDLLQLGYSARLLHRYAIWAREDSTVTASKAAASSSSMPSDLAMTSEVVQSKKMPRRKIVDDESIVDLPSPPAKRWRR